MRRWNWQKRKAEGDEQAKERLIEANLRLVVVLRNATPAEA